MHHFKFIDNKGELLSSYVVICTVLRHSVENFSGERVSE